MPRTLVKLAYGACARQSCLPLLNSVAHSPCMAHGRLVTCLTTTCVATPLAARLRQSHDQGRRLTRVNNLRSCGLLQGLHSQRIPADRPESWTRHAVSERFFGLARRVLRYLRVFTELAVRGSGRAARVRVDSRCFSMRGKRHFCEVECAEMSRFVYLACAQHC
jgi:hypothetical protein